MTPRGFIACSIAVSGACHLAAAQTLMFDEYAPGTQLHGVDGWRAWDGNAANGAVTSALFARSGTSSLAIQGRASGRISDLVQTYNLSSTHLVFTAWQYIPSSLTSGDSYFILMDRYNEGGAKHWATQLQFNLASNTVRDNLYGSFGNGTIVRDRWVPIEVDINLALNQQSVYYNGLHVFSSAWNRYSGGQLSLAAVDLYGSSGGTVFYDDVGVAAAPTPGAATLGACASLLMLGSRRR